MGRKFDSALFSLAASLFFSVFCELYFEALRIYQTGSYDGLLAGTYSAPIVLRTLALFLLCFFVGIAILASDRGRRLLSFIFRHRVLIGVCIVAVLVAFEVSGSSIGIYYSIYQGEGTGPYFGIPRSIRSDEWIVTTLLNASQAVNDYSPLSGLLGGATTNVSIGYNLPSWSIASIFRPFHWGYLFLGFARGLSFVWAARYMVLFLVSFDCALLYTKGDKYLSGCAALILTLSPFITWWGEVTEVLLFGQALVLILNSLIREDSVLRRAFKGCVLAWLCGCYIFVLYPAWMVPCFYIFALMGVWVVIDYRRELMGSGSEGRLFVARRDIPIVVIPLAVVAVLIALAFQSSATEIAAESGTVYPGARFETGGGGASLLLNYGQGLFFSIDPANALPNACEAGAFFTLFPLGSILAICLLVKLKGRDFLLASLLALQAFFVVFICFGIPDWLAKVTLLSNVPAARLVIGTGYIEVVLLLRSISLRACSVPAGLPEGVGGTRPVCHIRQQAGTPRHLSGETPDDGCRRVPRALILLVSCAISLCLVLVMRNLYASYLRLIYCVLLLVILAAMVYAVLSIVLVPDRSRYYERALLMLLVAVIVPTGLTVNPIQIGDSFLTDSNIVSAVREANDSSSAQSPLWVAVDAHLSTGNLCTDAGAATINCTNVVPNLDLWHRIDPSHEYEDVYNRYAHITVRLTTDPTSFELVQADSFCLHLNYGDLKTLGITNVISGTALEDDPSSGVSFQETAQVDGYHIYTVSYS
ncbi:MAG: hypothetical protein LKE50_04800 [Atopobiaceae bacterium]|nr:hypothetical protein [Atopobiaceae bacterium]